MNTGGAILRGGVLVPVTPWRVAVERLKPREAARVLYDAMRPLDMSGVVAAGVKGETIYWRVSRDGWTSVQWVTISQYAPELLRLRNDLQPFIPSRIWPFALPECRPFKLTFHQSEFGKALGEPVYAFCSAMAEKNVVLGWQLFDGEPGYPGYAWTPLARKWYAQFHKQG